MKNYSIKRAILALGLKRSEKTIFFSQKPNEICDRLCLVIQEKRAGNDTNRYDKEIIAIDDKL